MNILFVSNLYPPHDLGGMEIRCKETVDRLRMRGHGSHVLTSRYGLRGRPQQEEGITRALYLESDIVHYRPLNFFLRRPWQLQASRSALHAALDAFHPDVVFVWGLWNLTHQVAYCAEQCLPGRVAYAVAGYYFAQPNVHETYWRARARRLLAAAVMAPARWLALRILDREARTHPLQLEHVACVSHYVRRKLTKAGALPHSARVIYNGIDPTPFLQAAAPATDHGDEIGLVYTGSLVRHKGVLTAVNALGLLQQQEHAHGLHLTIVGAGHPDYEARLKRRVQELGLTERVTFSGRVPRRKIPGILAAHDVFLFTSVYEEPIARSVMEAMAAGLAVVATPVGGQQEMLDDGVNALVYPPGDASALAQCIRRLRQDPELLTLLANTGRNTVLQRFTIDRMVDEMEAWLEEIAG